jgi:hypothetical protein
MTKRKTGTKGRWRTKPRNGFAAAPLAVVKTFKSRNGASPVLDASSHELGSKPQSPQVFDYFGLFSGACVKEEADTSFRAVKC